MEGNREKFNIANKILVKILLNIMAYIGYTNISFADYKTYSYNYFPKQMLIFLLYILKIYFHSKQSAFSFITIFLKFAHIIFCAPFFCAFLCLYLVDFDNY